MNLITLNWATLVDMWIFFQFSTFFLLTLILLKPIFFYIRIVCTGGCDFLSETNQYRLTMDKMKSFERKNKHWIKLVAFLFFWGGGDLVSCLIFLVESNCLYYLLFLWVYNCLPAVHRDPVDAAGTEFLSALRSIPWHKMCKSTQNIISEKVYSTRCLIFHVLW